MYVALKEDTYMAKTRDLPSKAPSKTLKTKPAKVSQRLIKPPKDPSGPSPKPEPQDPERKDKQATLNSMKMRKFKVEPLTENTFGKTTVSWDVAVPANSPFEAHATLDGEIVAPSNRKDFTLTQTHTFTLRAEVDELKKTLGTLTVNVNSSGCQSRQVLSGDTITSILMALINGQFAGVNDIKLRGSKSLVTLSELIISAKIPLEIEVPDWFNAKMDIDAHLDVFMFQGAGSAQHDVSKKKWSGQAVRVWLKDFSVDVSWDWYAHMLSFGLLVGAQEGMEKMAEVLLTHIMTVEVLPPVQAQLNDQILAALNAVVAADPSHLYRLLAVDLRPDGLNVTACPVP
jgi:hypothetical protein